MRTGKDPYSAREQTISEAATSTAFCLKQNKDGQGTIITFRYNANSTALKGTGATLWSK